MEQRLGHACGVFGVYAPGQPVAHLAYLGLFALQHRGQESAGIAVSDGETITVVKDMGLVTQVFDERRLAPLDGHLAIGHNRYSTTGSSSWRNAQPVYRSVGDAGFALGHNGNLTNTVKLAERIGMLPGMTAPEFDLDSTTDSALVAELVAQEYSALPRSDGRDLEVALEKVLPRLEGGFSFVLMDDARLIGVRDPHGFWPLALGRIAGGWVLASESAALDIVGAHYVRDVEPGEMVAIDASGLRSHHFAEPSPKLCLFEFVYFSRPDTNLYGQSVHAARQRMGEELARQAKQRLRQQGCTNIELKIANGYHGWSEHAPFDKVIVTAAPDLIPPPLIHQLKAGGKMVIPAGLPDAQQLVLVEKNGNGKVTTKEILQVRFSQLEETEPGTRSN